MGATQPGMTVVCGDSHTATHGAFGALAFGIGTSEVGHVLATQCLLQRKPRSLAIRVDGTLAAGRHGEGPDPRDHREDRRRRRHRPRHGVHRARRSARLTMEGRMTLCNMAIEGGARAGLVAPDDVTFQWLAGKPRVPKGAAWDGRGRALAAAPDRRRRDATTARSTIDVSALEPMVTFGTNPAQGIPVTGRVPDPGAEKDPAARATLESALRYMALTPGQADPRPEGRRGVRGQLHERPARGPARGGAA